MKWNCSPIRAQKGSDSVPGVGLLILLLQSKYCSDPSKCLSGGLPLGRQQCSSCHRKWGRESVFAHTHNPAACDRCWGPGRRSWRPRGWRVVGYKNVVSFHISASRAHKVSSETITQTDDYIVWGGKNNDGISPGLYRRLSRHES